MARVTVAVIEHRIGGRLAFVQVADDVESAEWALVSQGFIPDGSEGTDFFRHPSLPGDRRAIITMRLLWRVPEDE